MDRRKVKVCKWCGAEYTVGRGQGRQGHCGKKRCIAKEHKRKREVEKAYRQAYRRRELEGKSPAGGKLKTCICGTKHDNRGELCLKCLARKATTYNVEGDYIYA